MPLSFVLLLLGERSFISHTHDMRRRITGAEPRPSLLRHAVGENPPESIRSIRTHRRPTIGNSLGRAVKEVLLSVAGLL